MQQSLYSYATEQFYKWEKRGRGWFLADRPIDLEPPHHPFFFNTGSPVPIDDGRHPSLYQRLKELFREPKKQIGHVLGPGYSALELFPSTEDYELCAFKVAIPKGKSWSPFEHEQCLLMLSNSKHAVSFEIIADAEQICIQFVCRAVESPYVRTQLRTYFSHCSIESFALGVDAILLDDVYTQVLDFGLDDEYMCPIHMNDKGSHDPYMPLLGVMNELVGDERIVVQILFSGTVNPWATTTKDAVTDAIGKSFFVNAPEMPKRALEKTSSPMFAVVVRCAVQTNNAERAEGLLYQSAHAITHFSKSSYNCLLPLSGNEYSFEDRISDIYRRESHRMGMLLNVRELITLLHLPYLHSPKLGGNRRKTKGVVCGDSGIILGTNIHEGIETEVCFTDTQRLKHTHIIGATGTGKSTLLLNLITQDIDAGNGICVIEPHGDLIERTLHTIPEHRIPDVCVIDPSDTDYPVGLNILKANSDIEKEVLSSDLVAALKRHATSWGDQMNSILANAILVFLESSRGGNLVDLKEFLLDKVFREKVLSTVSDSHICNYWQKQYPLLKSNSIGPILTRLDSFLRPKLIRNMIGQKEGLDFEAMLDGKKIILVKLSHGLIGEENSYLLGSFLVSKIQQAAMARQAKAASERAPFFLYIDEFQHFITPSMASILSGARKYGLGMTLAHQSLQQLQRSDSDIVNAVLSNAGTRICFRVGDNDARVLEKGFSSFEETDFLKLKTGEAICRIERSDNDFSLTVREGGNGADTGFRDEIIKSSRAKYAKPVQRDVSPIKEGTTQKEAVPSTQTSTEELKSPIAETTRKPKKQVEVVERFHEQVNEPVEADVQSTSKHRYLQTLIKKIAESKGFKADIELLTPDGKGRVDVSLEKEGLRIACEVSVTTDATWELHNIKKCLSAGYDHILLCSSQPKMIQSVQLKIKGECSNEEQQRIRVLDPEALFAYLDMNENTTSQQPVRMKGYRVKVNYSPTNEEESIGKKQSISKVVINSLRKGTKGKG
ncbi:MAG: hypothetical protein JWP69_580 [Flaviaesturariibacter sp.]|nr:hypothetical protein [Flaviaesturariibacter sp.]